MAGSISSTDAMTVRSILQFSLFSTNIFVVSVSQVYFQKGKVLQDSGFVGDALQLFLQCLALDEDFLPAKLEVEKVIYDTGFPLLTWFLYATPIMIDLECLKSSLPTVNFQVADSF